MLITHDLGVIAEMADYVVVMYAGRIVEKGTVFEIFENPKHPYTVGLMRSKPSVSKRVERLYSIPGRFEPGEHAEPLLFQKPAASTVSSAARASTRR